jgi:hypothetical protein
MRLEAFASTDRTGNRKLIVGCEMIDRLPHKRLPVTLGVDGKLEPQRRKLKPGLY